MMLALSSLATPTVVIMTTSGVTGGMEVDIVTASVFSDIT